MWLKIQNRQIKKKPLKQKEKKRLRRSLHLLTTKRLQQPSWQLQKNRRKQNLSASICFSIVFSNSLERKRPLWILSLPVISANCSSSWSIENRNKLSHTSLDLIQTYLTACWSTSTRRVSQKFLTNLWTSSTRTSMGNWLPRFRRKSKKCSVSWSRSSKATNWMRRTWMPLPSLLS